MHDVKWSTAVTVVFNATGFFEYVVKKLKSAYYIVRVAAIFLCLGGVDIVLNARFGPLSDRRSHRPTYTRE